MTSKISFFAFHISYSFLFSINNIDIQIIKKMNFSRFVMDIQSYRYQPANSRHILCIEVQKTCENEQNKKHLIGVLTIQGVTLKQCRAFTTISNHYFFTCSFDNIYLELMKVAGISNNFLLTKINFQKCTFRSCFKFEKCKN